MEADAVVGAEGNIATGATGRARGDSTGVVEQGAHGKVPQEPGRPHHLRESGTANQGQRRAAERVMGSRSIS